MPVAALEAAKLDAATLPRIKQIQATLKHAHEAAAKTTDPFEKHTLRLAIGHLQSSLDRLRSGPYGSKDQTTRQ